MLVDSFWDPSVYFQKKLVFTCIFPIILQKNNVHNLKNCMCMEALIVSFKDKTELKLVLDLLKKMNIEAKVLTQEEREDMGMV